MTSLMSRGARITAPVSRLSRRHIVVVSALVLAMAAPVLAQFVVFDPTNYGEAVQEFAQLERQYVQLVQSYRLMTTQATALSGDLNARYRSMATPWLALAAADTYGVTAGWVHTANTGHDPLVGYQSATEPLQAYGSAVSHMPADEVSRVKTGYGGVELTDGITAHALEMLGYLRGHSGDVEFALRRLEDDSYSNDPGLNTEVAVLNKVNAATVTSARLTKDTNQVLIAMLEEQLLEAKRRRDADAVAIDAHIAFELHARDLLEQSSAGTADALVNFRLP